MKKWTQKEDGYLRDNYSTKSVREIATALGVGYNAVYSRAMKLGLKKPEFDPKQAKEKREEATFKKKYVDACEKIERLEEEKRIILGFEDVEPIKIEPRPLHSGAESTAVALLSDWHFEETVTPQSVNGLNKFNTKIAEERIVYLFQTIVKFIKLHQNETTINNLVLALLGDFISGGIHDDLKEVNELQTIPAIMEVEKLIYSGILHILDNTEVNIVVPCSVGNHSRITEKQRVATEHGNSLELWMYAHLAKLFEGNQRVKFVINEGYHNLVNVFGYTLRFHHGHDIKYGGGIGGIFIPVYKAISQWNKGQHADLDCFGHFHQMKDGGNFISNGSLIGYNAFAVKIKADFEKPKQAFFLIDKKRFVICTRSILLNGNIKE